MHAKSSALLVCFFVVACGRTRYLPSDAGESDRDAFTAPSIDAPMASEDTPASDAPTVSPDAFASSFDAFTAPPDAFSADAFGPDVFGPDAFVDPACAAILADGASGTDDDVFRCGVTGQLGRCRIADARECPTCACDYYTINDSWDCAARCPADLTPTGCYVFRGSGDTTFPVGFDCASAVGTVGVGACILRHELLAGHCAACVCTS